MSDSPYAVPRSLRPTQAEAHGLRLEVHARAAGKGAFVVASLYSDSAVRTGDVTVTLSAASGEQSRQARSAWLEEFQFEATGPVKVEVKTTIPRPRTLRGYEIPLTEVMVPVTFSVPVEVVGISAPPAGLALKAKKMRSEGPENYYDVALVGPDRVLDRVASHTLTLVGSAPVRILSAGCSHGLFSLRELAGQRVKATVALKDGSLTEVFATIPAEEQFAE